MSTMWAALAAIGASVVFSALASAVLTAVTVEPLPQGGWFQHLSNERIVEWSALAAGAAGVAVSRSRGGVRAVALFLAYFVVLVAYAVDGALEAARLCQERLGCLSDLPSSTQDALVRQMPSVLGVAVGAVLGLLVRQGVAARTYALEAAGAGALLLVPVGMLTGVSDLRSGPLVIIASLPAAAAVLVSVALTAVAGLIIAVRSRLPTTTTVQFAAFGGVCLLPAATSAAMQSRWLEALIAVVATSIAIGLITAAAAVLGRRMRAPAAV